MRTLLHAPRSRKRSIALFGRPDADTSRTSMLIYNGNSGEYVSNTATVAVGADGTIQIMTETTARVVLDVQGYYTANTDGTAAGGFVPVAGKRFVDTRSGLGAPKATLAPGKSVDVQVTGANGVPAGASGAVVNLIAINTTSSDGNLTPYATGGTKPLNSLHYTPSTTTSIQAQVALSADGKMTIANSSSTINLVIDLQGYFTAAGTTGASFTPATGRAYDSRATGNTALAKNETRSIQIAGTAGVPVMGSGITAVVLTLIVSHGGGDGYAQVYADGTTNPGTTALNFQADDIRTNTITVPLGTNGKIALRNVADATNYIVDVQGWYTNPQAPTISCPAAYAAGSWTTTIPADSIMCTITAGPATVTGEQLTVTNELGETYSSDLSATATTSLQVAEAAYGGQHEIDAVRSTGAAQSYVFGLGNWAADTFVTSPADGATSTLTPTLALSPADEDSLPDDASIVYTVSTNADGTTNPVYTETSTGSVTVPADTLADGQQYYWTADITGQSNFTDSAEIRTPAVSFTANSNISTLLQDGTTPTPTAEEAAYTPSQQQKTAVAEAQADYKATASPEDYAAAVSTYNSIVQQVQDWQHGTASDVSAVMMKKKAKHCVVITKAALHALAWSVITIGTVVGAVGGFLDLTIVGLPVGAVLNAIGLADVLSASYLLDRLGSVKWKSKKVCV